MEKWIVAILLVLTGVTHGLHADEPVLPCDPVLVGLDEWDVQLRQNGVINDELTDAVRGNMDTRGYALTKYRGRATIHTGRLAITVACAPVSPTGPTVGTTEILCHIEGQVFRQGKFPGDREGYFKAHTHWVPVWRYRHKLERRLLRRELVEMIGALRDQACITGRES
jgi:hypothetical protein